MMALAFCWAPLLNKIHKLLSIMFTGLLLLIRLLNLGLIKHLKRGGQNIKERVTLCTSYDKSQVY